MSKLLAAWAAMMILAASPYARAVDDPPAAQAEDLLVSGRALPQFVSVDDRGQPWKSAEHVGRKVLVFYFYPGDFTGGCIVQAQSFREGLKSLEALDIEVIGVSGDQPATHELFKAAHELKHTLLADPEGALAAQLGIPARRSEKAAVVRAVNLDRKPLLDDQDQPITVERKVTYPRWTVIVDREGRVVSKRTQVNPSTDADEVRKLVEALPK
jgi:thioredoxin-dependent peroxiredoxin